MDPLTLSNQIFSIYKIIIIFAAVYMVYTVGTFFVQNTSLIKIDKVKKIKQII